MGDAMGLQESLTFRIVDQPGIGSLLNSQSFMDSKSLKSAVFPQKRLPGILGLKHFEKVHVVSVVP